MGRHLLDRRGARWLLGLSLLLAAPSAGAQNLVPNPGMEETDSGGDLSKPDAWTSNSWGDLVAEFDWLTEGASGGRSLRAEITSAGSEGDAKWMSDPFAIPQGGAEYTFKVMYRASVESDLAVRALGDGEQQWLSAAASLPVAGDWTLAEGTVTLPAWALEVEVGQVLGEVGFVETDNAIFEPGDTTSEEPEPDPGGTGQTYPGTLVSVSFDDGWVSAFEGAVPVMVERGLRGTHFIHSQWVDREGFAADHMTSPQLAQLVDAGHELGSHALFHMLLTEQPSEEQDQQLADSKQILEDLGFSVSGFAYPGGDYDEDVLAKVETHYDYARTVEEGLNHEPYDTYELQGVVVTDSMTLATMEEWIAKAHEEGGWLVLLYHRIGPDPQDTFVSAGTFEAQMDLLVDTEVDVRPMGEILGVWEPQEAPSDLLPEPTGPGPSTGESKTLPAPEFNGDKGVPGTPTGQDHGGGSGEGGSGNSSDAASSGNCGGARSPFAPLPVVLALLALVGLSLRLSRRSPSA